jgi:hypothetical protein
VSDNRDKSIKKIDQALAAIRERLIDHVDYKSSGSLTIELIFACGGVRSARFRESIDLTPWTECGKG